LQKGHACKVVAAMEREEEGKEIVPPKKVQKQRLMSRTLQQDRYKALWVRKYMVAGYNTDQGGSAR